MIRIHEAPRVAEAWSVSRGAGAVVAVVDESIDVSAHRAFSGRAHAPYAARPDGRHANRPAHGSHGTKVAGVIAANDAIVVGIAPAASVMPLAVPALGVLVGDSAESDALCWAADHGADIIVCAWSPVRSATEYVELPQETRDAIDHCLTHGRNGKGCVIVFSAGNDGSDLALNGYASHPGVIAVGACNCHGKHPAYSGWGDTLWCVFPSNDPHDPVGASMTYLTTAPVGSLLDGEAFYTTRFGFTSAACAAVAGICALIVSANPELSSSDVRAVLRDSCEKIDMENGLYDEHGHSQLYGYGRPDVARAVELAQQRTTFRESR